MEVTSSTTTTLKDRVVDSLLNNYRNFMKSEDVSMDVSLLPNWPIEFKLCKIIWEKYELRKRCITLLFGLAKAML